MAYEPGSVFKIFSLATLLDVGAITQKTLFFCDGRYEHTTPSGEKIIIKCTGEHGWVNTDKILAYSCNAGAAYASDTVDDDTFYTKICSFGFGTKTGAGVPGETAGSLRPVDEWSARSKPTIAIGQEIAVSALQILRAATAIANDGIMVTPHYVSSFATSDNKLLAQFRVAQPQRVISAQTAVIIRDGMEAGVNRDSGIGWKAGLADVRVGVKTGTAQMIDETTGKYSDTDYIASTLAMLPIEKPSLIIYMAIIRPKGRSYYGAARAAPAVREAAERLVNYLGIKRGKSPQVSRSGVINLRQQTTPTITTVIPNFTGAGKKQLLPLFARNDIRFIVKGDGWVVRQDPPPGTPFRKGMTITLEFE
jgi:cell division protein FtsI (penicillin-binding protein 3)